MRVMPTGLRAGQCCPRRRASPSPMASVGPTVLSRAHRLVSQSLGEGRLPATDCGLVRRPGKAVVRCCGHAHPSGL